MQRWFRSRQQCRNRMRKIKSVRPAFASDLAEEEPRYRDAGRLVGTARALRDAPSRDWPRHSHVRLVLLVQRPHLFQRLPQLLHLQYRARSARAGRPWARPAAPAPQPRSPGRAAGARRQRGAAPAPAPPPAPPPCRRARGKRGRSAANRERRRGLATRGGGAVPPPGPTRRVTCSGLCAASGLRTRGAQAGQAPTPGLGRPRRGVTGPTRCFTAVSPTVLSPPSAPLSQAGPAAPPPFGTRPSTGGRAPACRPSRAAGRASSAPGQDKPNSSTPILRLILNFHFSCFLVGPPTPR